MVAPSTAILHYPIQPSERRGKASLYPGLASIVSLSLPSWGEEAGQKPVFRMTTLVYNTGTPLVCDLLHHYTTGRQRLGVRCSGLGGGRGLTYDAAAWEGLRVLSPPIHSHPPTTNTQTLGCK